MNPTSDDSESSTAASHSHVHREVILTRAEPTVMTEFIMNYYKQGDRSFIKIPVSEGYERTFLHRQQLPVLKRIVLFLLQQQVINHPEMYTNFESLSDKDGSMGREILLNTLFQEPAEVIEMAFEIVGRVQFKDAMRDRKKKQNAMVLKMKLGVADIKEPKDSKDMNDKLSTDNEADTFNFKAISHPTTSTDESDDVSEFPFEYTIKKLRDVVDKTTEAGKEGLTYEFVSSGNAWVPVRLHAKVSTTVNDPEVYVTHPVRTINGQLDHMMEDIQPLCGPKISEFFEHTSKEVGRVAFETQEDRLELARDRREICMYKPNALRVKDLIQKRLNKEFYEMPLPDNEDVSVKQSHEDSTKQHAEQKKSAQISAKYYEDMNEPFPGWLTQRLSEIAQREKMQPASTPEVASTPDEHKIEA